jgi:hypothetical protein
MTAKEKANQFFSECYKILFDSDSDKGEEILVSVLPRKLAHAMADDWLEYHKDEPNKIIYWQEVKNEIDLL